MTRKPDAAKNLLDALTAIAAGYNVSVRDDRYICVENPEYRPDWGNNPSIVIDVEEVREFLGFSDRAMVSSNPSALTPDGWGVDTPLDWTDLSHGSSFARTPFGTYRVEPPRQDYGVHEWRWSYCFDEYYDEGEYSCNDRDHGKALAQAHWDERVSSIFRIRAATPPTHAEGDGWRPIETAPDDTEVFAWSPKYGGIYLAIKQDGEWWVPDLHPSNWEPIDAPTHWMPLPAAPTDE